MKNAIKKSGMNMQSLILDALWRGCLKVVAVNVKTWEYTVLKEITYDDSELGRMPSPPMAGDEEVEIGTNLWEYVSDLMRWELVHPDDIKRLGDFLQELRENQEALWKQHSYSFVFRHKVEGAYRNVRLEVAYPSTFSKDNPIGFYILKFAYGSDYSRQDTLRLISFGYRKVLRINIDTDKFEIIKMDNDEWMTVPGKKISFSEWTKRFADRYIHPGDQDDFKKFVDLENIKSAMESGEYPMKYYYRRMGVKGVENVCMEIIPSVEYENTGNTVLLYVKDAPAEVEDLDG